MIVDPEEFKGVIRTFQISNFQPCNKHQVLWFSPIFIQPYLIRNWTTDSQASELSETPSFSKNGNRRYKYLVLGQQETYFVKEHSDSKNKYSEDYIIKMPEFLIDNIFAVFARKVFQQTVCIPMGTNCAPFLADIFLYSYTKRNSHSFCSQQERNS